MPLMFMQGSVCDGLKTIKEDFNEYQSLEKSIYCWII